MTIKLVKLKVNSVQCDVLILIQRKRRDKRSTGRKLEDEIMHTLLWFYYYLHFSTIIYIIIFNVYVCLLCRI